MAQHPTIPGTGGGGGGGGDITINGVIPSVNSGNKDNGTLRVVVATDQPAFAVITSAVVSSTSSAPAQTTVTTTASSILASNSSRKRFALQNTGLTVLFIGLGQTPTTSAYHFALRPGGTANDGTSPVWLDTMWTGGVQAISSGTGGTIVVTELT